jgi:Tfp pilus assembly protein PilE
MHTKQRGVGLMGLITALVIVVVLALFGMKVLPSFMEFRSAKSAIEAASAAQSPADVRRAFENRATIDNINSIKPTDLEITREGSQMVVAFAYRKEVPLFGGVGLYIDYAANSRGN